MKKKSASRPVKKKTAGRPLKTLGISVQKKLIDAGTELLKKGSLEDFSLRKAAVIAGVSHAAAYHHFENKNALLAAIAEQGFEKYFSSYEEEVARTGEDFDGRFRALGWTYVKFIIKNSQYARLMFGGLGLDQKNHPALRIISRRTYRQLHEIIRDGQKNGFIEDGHAREKTLAAWAMIHGIAMLILEGRLNPGNDLEEIRAFVRSVTDYAYIGIKK
ncbi:MAG TPA: TetR/AcrR family transcriptional regulator [Leptospiraceae bacterium]|nr:TetR/AcrR family transcriptional regulator [Leptospiraceae bacterium]